MTGANYNTSYQAQAFSENVAALRSVPLIVQQISSKLWGILLIAKTGVLMIVVSRCRQRQWRLILVLWIIGEIVHVLVVKGARTSLVMFVMAAVLFYHRMIRPLSMKFLIASAISFIVFFNFLALYRTYADLRTMRTVMAKDDVGLLWQHNEFEGLLGTAYDVLQLKKAGVELPWYLYINDFTGCLPPQQLLPFEKVSGAEWYLRQIGFSGKGVGCMWGVISQSIVGLDWIELFFRGSILGLVLAKLHRWYVRNESGFIETLFYVYLCLKVYYTFRDTTFSILANIIWEVIPFYVLLKCGVALVTGIARQKQYARISLSTVS